MKNVICLLAVAAAAYVAVSCVCGKQKPPEIPKKKPCKCVYTRYCGR